MVLTHLLDTSVFSQPIKDRPVEAALSRWEELGDGAVCTSAICVAEVKQGLEVRRSEKFWRRYNELLADRYPVLSFDENTAATYAGLVAGLRNLGTPRPTLDLFIAATAKQYGLVLATLNFRDFDGIPGLGVEYWG